MHFETSHTVQRLLVFLKHGGAGDEGNSLSPVLGYFQCLASCLAQARNLENQTNPKQKNIPKKKWEETSVQSFFSLQHGVSYNTCQSRFLWELLIFLQPRDSVGGAGSVCVWLVVLHAVSDPHSAGRLLLACSLIVQITDSFFIVLIWIPAGICITNSCVLVVRGNRCACDIWFLVG